MGFFFFCVKSHDIWDVGTIRQRSFLFASALGHGSITALGIILLLLSLEFPNYVGRVKAI